ncbi:integrase [Salmonella enterica subsp. enterica]|uniref:Integrase n=1 Tax=Salmonella enterica I TaxID=59201 RepID=A0A379W4P2_SALET|nr:integrase [Salmonella enterica subsp. enterica]
MMLGGYLDNFSVHDLRRTASTLLHEAGYPSDWIEKALAHEQKGVRAVYNKAEYARQRAYMLQQWADMVDAGLTGSTPIWCRSPRRSLRCGSSKNKAASGRYDKKR